MGATYSFDTTWRMPATTGRCWTEIERMLRSDTAGTWWPSVSVEAPTALAAGDDITLAVRVPLGDPLRAKVSITGIDAGRSIKASSGGDDVQGKGGVEIREDGDEASVIIFHWDVVAKPLWTKASMIALRPIFEPVIVDVMKEGEEGLRAALLGS